MIEVSELVEVINITVDEINESVNIIVTEISTPISLQVSEMGAQGLQGLSAYQIAVNNGFVGTEAQWLLSLQATGQIKIYQEVPTGLLNGINATFTTLFNFVSGTLEIFLNGQLQKIVNDYQLIGNNTINLNTSPTAGENILINYIKL